MFSMTPSLVRVNIALLFNQFLHIMQNNLTHTGYVYSLSLSANCMLLVVFKSTPFPHLYHSWLSPSSIILLVFMTLASSLTESGDWEFYIFSINSPLSRQA